MAATHSQMPVLDLSGTPGQIGAAHGEAQRDRIREYADRFIGFILRTAPDGLTEEAMWQRWAGQVPHNQREAPDLVEEMRGIARGAGVPFERIFLLNSFLDLHSFLYREMADNLAGCTTFAVAAENGAGQTVIGQTYDMPAFHEDYVTLLRLKPANGPRQVVFTFAGIVGAAGHNEAGIGVNINYLSPRDVGIGRLHCIAIRQILAAKDLAAAVTPALVPPRAGGAHYLVADRDGNIVSIETTGKRMAIFYPEGNAIGHTNHYLSEWLKEVEHIRPKSIGSSVARYAALKRFLRDRGATLTRNELQELTRNHNSYPRSICAHGTEPDGTGSRTVSSMVQLLDDQAILITKGCACENDYETVALL